MARYLKVNDLVLPLGGVASVLAVFAHIGIIIGGPSWYHFFSKLTCVSF